MNIHKLSSVQLDVLREIGNIGAGNAATSMAKLIQKQIDMDVTSVDIVTFDEMIDMIGGPQQLIVSMYFDITGEAPGTVYFILTIEEAEMLLSQMFAENRKLITNRKVDDIAISALQELSNI